MSNTNDDTLRQACDTFMETFMTFDLPTCEDHAKALYEDQFAKLLCFARTQQAVGVRKAHDNFYAVMSGNSPRSTDDDAWAHLSWCEAQARELEGTP